MAKEQEATVIGCNLGNSNWTQWRKKKKQTPFQWEWLSTGTGFPEGFWNLCHWIFIGSTLGQTKPWQLVLTSKLALLWTAVVPDDIHTTFTIWIYNSI